jgi:hypothetical protein
MYLLPRLEVTGNWPVRLVAIWPVTSVTAANIWWIGVLVSVRVACGSLGGTSILLLVVEMSFDGGNGFGEFIFDELGGEARPHGKISVLDGLYPSRGHGATAGGMQVGYQVGLVRCMVCTVKLAW